MMDYEENPQDIRSGGGSIIVFLGLYLLLVAFFILLNSISTVEEDKAKEAIFSVNSAFEAVGIPSSRMMRFSSDIGSFAEAATSLVKIGALVKTAISLARVEEVIPGQLMQIEITAEELFVAGEARLKEESNSLLNKVGRILSDPPEDLRFDVEIIVGSEWILPDDLAQGETLEVARAGTLARELRARGAPEGSIVAGIEIGDPNHVRMMFHVRGKDEPRVDFKQLVR